MWVAFDRANHEAVVVRIVEDDGEERIALVAADDAEAVLRALERVFGADWAYGTEKYPSRFAVLEKEDVSYGYDWKYSGGNSAEPMGSA